VPRLLCAFSFLLASAAVLLAPSLGVAQLYEQAPKVYRIAYISPGTPNPTFDAFTQRLGELGYVEGKNVIIDTYYAEGHPERLPALAAEAIDKRADVLVVGATIATLAAKKATSTVPIVFASLFDPVATGVVTSLERPAGNVTGAAMDVGGSGFYGKWVELLKEASPGVGHVAVLAGTTRNALGDRQMQEVQAAARALNVKLDVLHAGNAGELDGALATIGASGAQGMIVMPDPFFTPNREKLAQFATSKRLPAMYFFKVFADAGGLMAYAPSQEATFRGAAIYVDKILKGAKPGDLPIQLPPRPELIVNLKAAKGIGLTFPPSMLQRADKVLD
jgi:putative ABC transport system substrate-binding protein